MATSFLHLQYLVDDDVDTPRFRGVGDHEVIISTILLVFPPVYGDIDMQSHVSLLCTSTSDSPGTQLVPEIL